MARSRTLKPEFFTHFELYQAEVAAGLPLRLAYEGLWTQADRAGRFAWKPHTLKLGVLPYDPVDFGAVLDALERGGFIRSYEVGGKRYGMIPTFVEHQNFHVREAQSRLPAPPDAEPGGSTGLGSAEHGVSTPDTDTDSDTDTDTDSDAEASGAAASAGKGDSVPTLTYAQRCAIAANQALRTNPHTGLGELRPLLASDGGAPGDWQKAGIPIETAELAIRNAALRYRPTERNPQPTTLKYFDGPVRDAHAGATVTPVAGAAPASSSPRIRRVGE